MTDSMRRGKERREIVQEATNARKRSRVSKDRLTISTIGTTRVTRTTGTECK